MKLQLGSMLDVNAQGEREERANIFVGSRSGKIEVTLVSICVTMSVVSRVQDSLPYQSNAPRSLSALYEIS